MDRLARCQGRGPSITGCCLPWQVFVGVKVQRNLAATAQTTKRGSNEITSSTLFDGGFRRYRAPFFKKIEN